MEFYGALYASNAKVSLSLEDMNEILSVSQKKNRKSSITGILYEEEGIFLQYLEGNRRSVNETLNRIRLDTRHSGLNLIWAGETKTRYFNQWEMGFVQQRIVSLSELVNLQSGLVELEQFEPIDLLVFLSASNELISDRAA